MSDKNISAQVQSAVAQATMQVLNSFVPQLFSSPKIISGNSKDSRDQDAYMMSNFPAEVLIPLAALDLIAQEDNRPEIKEFVTTVLRGFKGIGGFTSKQGETIAIGLSGGRQQRKIVKKPGVIGRTITNRGWERKARDEGSEIAE